MHDGAGTQPAAPLHPMLRVAQSTTRAGAAALRSGLPRGAQAVVPAAVVGAVRTLILPEYRNMQLLKQYGVNVPMNDVATTADEAQDIARSMGEGIDVVLKAQALTGGRGLGRFDNGLQGGVQICTSLKQVKTKAAKMIGHRLFTKQTGEAGLLVDKLLVVERQYLRNEMYLAFMLDRKHQGPVLIASSEGGVSIESVAATNPEAILTMPLDLARGPSDEDCMRVAEFMGVEGAARDAIAEQVARLYAMFLETDATLLEINPLAETSTGDVVAVDCKLNIDDNADFRRPELFAMREVTAEDQLEIRASKAGLNYIALDGMIGCLVNGAGLAMATTDLISLHGAQPANFLDLGGGADEARVTEAFRILTSDPKVASILVNIFGGITHCDVVASGLCAAIRELNLQLPIVVYLQGTRVPEARRILQSSGLQMIMADDLEDAARKSVKLAEIMKTCRDINVDVHFVS